MLCVCRITVLVNFVYMYFSVAVLYLNCIYLYKYVCSVLKKILHRIAVAHLGE